VLLAKNFLSLCWKEATLKTSRSICNIMHWLLTVSNYRLYPVCLSHSHHCFHVGLVYELRTACLVLSGLKCPMDTSDKRKKLRHFGPNRLGLKCLRSEVSG